MPEDALNKYRGLSSGLATMSRPRHPAPVACCDARQVVMDRDDGCGTNKQRKHDVILFPLCNDEGLRFEVTPSAVLHRSKGHSALVYEALAAPFLLVMAFLNMRFWAITSALAGICGHSSTFQDFGLILWCPRRQITGSKSRETSLCTRFIPNVSPWTSARPWRLKAQVWVVYTSFHDVCAIQRGSRPNSAYEAGYAH